MGKEKHRKKKVVQRQIDVRGGVNANLVTVSFAQWRVGKGNDAKRKVKTDKTAR